MENYEKKIQNMKCTILNTHTKFQFCNIISLDIIVYNSHWILCLSPLKMWVKYSIYIWIYFLLCLSEQLPYAQRWLHADSDGSFMNELALLNDTLVWTSNKPAHFLRASRMNECAVSLSYGTMNERIHKQHGARR